MKSLKNMFAYNVAILAISTIAAVAGSVYDNATVPLSTTAGTGTWTNTVNYAALKLVRIRTEASTDAGSTVTVARVYTDRVGTVYTNAAITTIVATAGKGSSDLTNWYVKANDKLVFANSTSTGATCVIEYEVQRP